MKSFSLLFFLLTAFVGRAQTYTVGTQNFTWTDAARSNRSIPVEIRYPGTNSTVANDSFPFIVFGHGFQMTGDNYYSIFDSLVIAGYIVALPGTETSLSPSHSEFGKDLIFIYNKLISESQNNASSPFYHHVVAKGAIGGHSMGGGATVLSCQFGTPATCYFTFAAANTNPSSIAAAHFMDKPYLAFAGSRDCIAPPATNQLPMYDSSNAPCKVFVEILNATHCQFGSGNVACNFGEGISGCAATPLSRTAQINKTLLFLSYYLDYYLKADCDAGSTFNAIYDNNSIDTLRRSCNDTIPTYCYVNGFRSLCPNSTTTLTVQPSNFQYLWSDGSVDTSLTVTAVGNYSVVLSNGICSLSAVQIHITPDSLPAMPSPIIADDTVCSHISSISLSVDWAASVSWNWTLPAGWSFTINEHYYTPTVTSGINGGTISVTAENHCGVSAPVTKDIVVIPSNLGTPGTISGPDSLCAGNTVWYSVAPVAGADSYEWGWYDGPGTHIPIDSNAFDLVPVTSGLLWVWAVNECGSSMPSTLWVVVDSIPSILVGNISGPDKFCEGLGNGSSYVLNLQSDSAQTYHWTLPVGWSFVSDSNTLAPIINVTTSGTIQVTTSNLCGASTALSLNVTVIDTPQAQISYAGNLLMAAPVGSSYSYSWFLDGQSISGVTTDTLTATQNGVYAVVVTDTNGCSGATSINHTFSKVSDIGKAQCRVFPNPASNGWFEITAGEGLARGELRVYNLLSQLVLTLTLHTETSGVDVSGLSRGTYLLVISKGEAVFRQKLVIEKGQ